jgi:hypothetical protein
MLGFPEHLIPEPERNQQGSIVSGTVQPVMLSLQRMATPESEDEPATPWFVGQMDSRIDIPSVKGMSGGPIYGFRRSDDGRWWYHVVALQSWWNRQTRTVYGCSLPVFAEALLAAFQDSGATE